MVEGVMELLPAAQVWHIGLYRDEKTLRPVQYYNRLPTEPTVQICLVLDPMLATGGSAVATVDILKRWGVHRIKYMGLIAAPEGVERLTKAHPDVPIHVASIDERPNEIGFIIPIGRRGHQSGSSVTHLGAFACFGIQHDGSARPARRPVGKRLDRVEERAATTEGDSGAFPSQWHRDLWRVHGGCNCRNTPVPGFDPVLIWPGCSSVGLSSLSSGCLTIYSSSTP
jgi:hypothetical protein